jgi:four helix bundle protein
MFNHEKLEVWREAISFASCIYSVTKNFPTDERFGLTNQMRRAAVSVSSNIAEGSSRSSRQDFARFVEIAAGSMFEVISQSEIAKNEGYLREPDFRSIYYHGEKLGRMLSGLRNSLLATRTLKPSTIINQPST